MDIREGQQNYAPMFARYRNTLFAENGFLKPEERAELIRAKEELLGDPTRRDMLKDISHLVEISDLRYAHAREIEMGYDPWHCYGHH